MANGDDPAYLVVKTLVVDYRVGGKVMTATGQDTEHITFLTSAAPPRPVLDVARGEIWQSGEYVFKTAGGRSRRPGGVAGPAGDRGPWEVSFDPKWGGPAKVVFEKLEDWSQRPEEGIRLLRRGDVSKSFHVSSVHFPAGYLDFGKVAVMAEVKLNGKKLGILWKPPYRVDVTER